MTLGGIAVFIVAMYLIFSDEGVSRRDWTDDQHGR